MGQKKILVLGIGNILLHDEGVGVRVVERLQTDYDFSPNVELMDGGILGLGLLEPICEADVLIVVDAVKNGRPPGTLYRLQGEELVKSVVFEDSLHQMNLLETLALAQVLGKSPGTAVVIGVEPADISPWSTELTGIIQECVPDLCAGVLEEIEKAGGVYAPKDS